jgi:anti-anti-sigma factor
MKLVHTTKDNILIVTLDLNTLDAREAPQFKEHLISLIDKKNLLGVVIDLKHLQFIDSSGLGSFLSALRVLHTNGGDLKLSHMNKPIRSVFELVRMHKIFEIFNTTEDALKSFSKS